MNPADGTALPNRSRRLGFARRMQGLKPSAIREILKVTESPEIISFAGGLPAPELFPIAAFARASADILAQDGQAALQYGPSEGYGPLRTWVAESLSATVSLEADASNILITHGSQQGLDLLARIFFDPGDTVVVENPAYLGALQAFQAYEPRIVGLPSDEAGLLPESLSAFLRSQSPLPKAVYLVTTFQNPTGRTTSLERRKALAGIAAEHGVLVIEDDPYGALRYSGEPLPALASFCTGPWAYLGTTSKTLAPGLRVAWAAVSHPEIFTRLLTAKQACDLHTSSFSQRLVHRVLTQPGFLEEQIRTLVSVYRSRRDVMLQALDRTMPRGTSWTRPDGGLFLWVDLPESIDALALLERSIEQKVAFVPGAPFWVGEPRAHSLRLNFSNATPERITVGIERLAASLKAMG